VSTEKKRPPAFSDRPLGSLDELVSTSFPEPQAGAALRRLWQALESAFSLDLRGLRPDDRAQDIVGEVDSITGVELIVALDVPLEPPGLTLPGGRSLADATVRELVELLRSGR
jgi:hypothetical protein